MTISGSLLGVLAAGGAPLRVQESARRVENAGFGEFWVPEDYYDSGGFTSAALALAATRTIPVGIGVLSVLTRHPAVIAMEASTLAGAFPYRFLAGLGTGLTQSIESMQLVQPSPLRAVRESFDAIQSLLEGELVTGRFGPHSLLDARLAEAPAHRPAMLVGGLGPKMLELAGEIADSVILSSLSSPAYVRWAKQHIAAGARRAGRPCAPPIRVFAWYSIDEDRHLAQQSISPSVVAALGFIGPGPLTDADGYSNALAQKLAEGGPADLGQGFPSTWIEQLVVAGDPHDCEKAIQERLDAGADTVVLCPTPAQGFDSMVELTSTHILQGQT
jgi:5,10-methylenetetrahydromethanopterin reductase